MQFKYAGGGDASAITILGITDKVYHNTSDKPLWVVENTHHNLSYYDAMWGLVSPQYENHVNTSTLQKEFLWLPGYSNKFIGTLIDGYQNAPGSTFYVTAMMETFSLGATTAKTFDYTGKNNFAIYRAWQKNSRSADGIAHMLKLVWTDVAANSVVGTKGWVSQAPAVPDGLQKRSSEEAVRVPTYSYSNKVQFNYLYGIPAFVLCLASILLIAATLVSGVKQKVGFGKLRKYINRTYMGVSTMALLYPESSGAGNKEWESATAKQKLIIGTQRPLLASKPENAAEPTGTAEESLTAGGITHSDTDAGRREDDTSESK